MPRFIKKGKPRFRRNRRLPGGDRRVTDKIQSRTDHIVVGLHQHLGPRHGLAKETLVEQTEFVPRNPGSQRKHEFKDIAASHEV